MMFDVIIAVEVDAGVTTRIRVSGNERTHYARAVDGKDRPIDVLLLAAGRAQRATVLRTTAPVFPGWSSN